jgi:hypothetical protein
MGDRDEPPDAAAPYAATIALPADASAAAIARQFVEDNRDHLRPDLVADTQLLVSEIVTNACCTACPTSRWRSASTHPRPASRSATSARACRTVHQGLHRSISLQCAGCSSLTPSPRHGASERTRMRFRARSFGSRSARAAPPCGVLRRWVRRVMRDRPGRFAGGTGCRIGDDREPQDRVGR